MQQLFIKYLKNECTPEEVDALLLHFDNPKNELLLRQLIQAELERLDDANKFADTDVRLAAIHKRLKQHILLEKAAAKPRQFWKRLAVAAILLIAAAVSFLLISKQETPAVLVIGNIKAVSPGSNAATLTLANGTSIKLTDAKSGQLATQAGATITKNAAGQVVYQATGTNNKVEYNTLSTVNGQQFTVELPDGTEVTLNAGSSLYYPVSFAGLKERRVELKGEGFFVVKHNTLQPFVVAAGKQYVQDIGTEFNISSYADENTIRTTLVSGSARVVASGQAVVLAPAQQGVFNGVTLTSRTVDPAVFVAWKKGLFAYKETPLQDVMQQIARWYNVQVVYEHAGLRSRRLSGSVSRYDEVTGILHAISYTAKVKFKIEGRTVTVLGAE